MSKACHVPVPARLQQRYYCVLHGGERCYVRKQKDRDSEDCGKPAVKFGLCETCLLAAYNDARLQLEANERENVELKEFMRKLVESC